MNQSDFEQILESLQSFILLKRQNCLIYAWMELKKRNRKIASLRSSRQKSFQYRSISSKQGQLQGNSRLNYTQQVAMVDNSSTPHINRRDYRVATENQIDQKQSNLLDTFNKDPQINVHALTEKSNFQHSPSRNILPTQNQEAELEDSDQFEDIVLDRLSKLQENINNLMREKKMKEQKRGNVGNPISNPYVKQRAHYEQPREEQPRRANQKFTNVQERRQKFFESLHNNYLEEPKEIIYNMKYIPVNREGEHEPKSNIERIRRIIDNNHPQNEIDYYNITNRRAEAASRKASTSLYINRYLTPTYGDRIHYAPVNIDRQTTIQTRPRYARYSFKEKKTTREQDLNQSKVSQHSVSSQRNNLSSYY